MKTFWTCMQQNSSFVKGGAVDFIRTVSTTLSPLVKGIKYYMLKSRIFMSTEEVWCQC